MRIIRNEGALQFATRTKNVLHRRLLWKLQDHPLTRRIYRCMFDSRSYWDHRYAKGDTSGPGSRGEHARFKAEVVNGFITDHDISSVVEFGCGDGQQVALGEYPSYVGLDVAESAVERCSERFADNPTYEFEVYDPQDFDDHDRFKPDSVLSLGVLFHLVSDEIFEKTIYGIFNTAEQYVIIFSSNHDESASEIHVRHRKFTDYVAEEFPDFELIDWIENPFEYRVSDFYIYE